MNTCYLFILSFLKSSVSHKQYMNTATLFHLFSKAVLQVAQSALEIHCEWRECYTW